MNAEKILANARKLASTAKNGVLKIEGKTYTFAFNHADWVYVVNDGEFDVLRINNKSLVSAKKFFKWYLVN